MKYFNNALSTLRSDMPGDFLKKENKLFLLLSGIARLFVDVAE